MKNLAQKKRKTNILRLADNPRFQPTESGIYIPKIEATSGDVFSHSLGENLFGLMRGDRLICRADFNLDALNNYALVINERDGKRDLRTIETAENIVGVVTAYLREVAR